MIYYILSAIVSSGLQQRSPPIPYNFIPCDREQVLLLPPSMLEWLPEDHLALFILDAVSQIDISQFYAKRRSDGWGRAAFEPSMMVSLMLYAYSKGVTSSRKIETACAEDIAFRVISAQEYWNTLRFLTVFSASRWPEGEM